MTSSDFGYLQIEVGKFSLKSGVLLVLCGKRYLVKGDKRFVAYHHHAVLNLDEFIL